MGRSSQVEPTVLVDGSNVGGEEERGWTLSPGRVTQVQQVVLGGAGVDTA